MTLRFPTRRPRYTGPARNRAVIVLGITAALLGWIGPIQAAVIHLGPDVLVFLNSVKLLRVRI